MTYPELRYKLASLLYELENSIGADYSGSTFNSRFRIQKSVYLLQALGFDFGKRYRFSNYLKGPYSPALAKDYYDLPPSLSRPGFGRPGLRIPEEILDRVKDANERGILFLEAVTTLHHVASRNQGATQEMVFRFVRELKPHVSRELVEAWQFLNEAGLIQSST